MERKSVRRSLANNLQVSKMASLNNYTKKTDISPARVSKKSALGGDRSTINGSDLKDDSTKQYVVTNPTYDYQDDGIDEHFVEMQRIRLAKREENLLAMAQSGGKKDKRGKRKTFSGNQGGS